jgi:hypothetical protein
VTAPVGAMSGAMAGSALVLSNLRSTEMGVPEIVLPVLAIMKVTLLSAPAVLLRTRKVDCR